VALSGEGADELFGGYLTYRANQLAHRARRLPPWVLRTARSAAGRWPVSDEKIGFEYMLKRFTEGCLMPAARAHVHWNGTFCDEEKARLVKMPLPAALTGMLDELPANENRLNSWLRFDQRWYLPDDILAKVDRMSMAHSIEVRPPYLDHRIVEFANSLPDHLKVDGRRQKIVLRELMKQKLPASILQRKKVGFDFPAHQWFRGPLRGLLLDSISTDNSGLFRQGALETCARQHLERRRNLGYHLWGLMLLLLWMKRWRIQTPQTFDPARRTASIATSI
jgi:asparagine synthase (glutamine-hydrolysing)